MHGKRKTDRRINIYEEPEVIINGINMVPGCSMTIRVAIEVFASNLIENGLGDDSHGIAMVKKYLARIYDIRRAMGVIK
jgi:hypothetical protein